MNAWLAPLLLSLASVPSAQAQAQFKNCEELRAEIAAKLEAKGVRHYRLHIVDSAVADQARIVGSCQGGTRRISYVRELPALAAATPTRSVQ